MKTMKTNLTADTITDNHVLEMSALVESATGADGTALCKFAGVKWLDDIEQLCTSALSPAQGRHYTAARARIAEILNRRAKESTRRTMTRPRKPKRPGPAPLSGKHGVRAPVVQVKLTPEQAARWRAAAEKNGLSLSAWVRALCDTLIHVNVKEAP